MARCGFRGQGHDAAHRRARPPDARKQDGGYIQEASLPDARPRGFGRRAGGAGREGGRGACGGRGHEDGKRAACGA
ncbi:hypothetical protein [Chelativorans sp. AA-79]|uniref:hypothetical protein n=1 Tax=Chelativorans sp. AA-79 TaxID=3028735 RepID=UPI003211E5AA